MDSLFPYLCVCVCDTPGYAHGSLLAKVCVGKYGMLGLSLVSCVQGKHPTYCTNTLASYGLSLELAIWKKHSISLDV